VTFRSLRFSLSAGALLFALASEAAAVELGGRFEGKLSCTGLDAEGNSVKQSLRDSELLVAQDEADLVVSIDELIYTGVLVEALGDEEREGAAVVAACNGDGDPQGRLESFLIEAKGTPGSVKASLKLRSVNGTGGALECSGSYKRVDAKEVPLDECPVFYSCVCVGVNDGEDACGNGGAGGNNGDVHADRTEAQRVGLYETGADTGWVCVTQ
jgi:hypothetical protein